MEEGIRSFKAEWHWMPHEKHVWVPGTLVLDKAGKWMMHTMDGEKIPVADIRRNQKPPKPTIPSESQTRVFYVEEKKKVLPYNWVPSEGKWEETTKLQHIVFETLQGHYHNLGDMEDMSEAPCNHQLRRRYMSDEIYTWMGSILVAINPYKLMPIYTFEHISMYSGSKRDSRKTLRPHIFSVASKAYESLVRHQKNQAVIISGESGAGKTESTKLILQFLGEMSRRAGRTESKRDVEQEIMLSNPILEAFGNAKTAQNDNSSRFGKWMEIGFTIKGAVKNARIQVYLLERSRVVAQNPGERNYHAFYMLTRGAPKEWKQRLQIDSKEPFAFAKQSNSKADYRSELQALIDRMQHLGFSQTLIEKIFDIVAAVLHLGNLNFELKEGTNKYMEEAEIKDQGRIQLISDLLHVDRKEIEKSLLFRVISVGNERHATPVPIDEVKTVRDATAKYIYGKLFLFLVDHLNSRFGQAGEYRSIGVLDIFGFEVFEKNTFEQFCINYANEKLQYLFNQHVFLGELKEYKSQGIDISGVTFTNNKGCLDLIEKKQGIIAMMGEEAALPRGDAKGLINKMHRKFKTNKFYKHIMRAPMSFVVAHYAGKVRYEIKDFLQKDNDFLSADIITALEATTNETVEAMLREFRARSSVGEDTRSSTLKKKNIRHSSSSFLSKRLMTVSAQFRTHLTALMQKLQTAEPHYVRCLKPNGSKLPNVYDSRIVLRQITYAGLLQAIKLRRMGFPYRQTHKEFVRQYQICTQRRRANTTRSRSLERLRPPKTIENLFRDRARTQSPPVGKQRKHLHRRGRSAAHLNLERLKIEKLERYIKNKQKESTPKTQTIKDQLEKLIQTMWPHLYAIDSSLTEADYRIGKTKIFLKSSLRNALGTHWKACMKSRVVQIQSLYRMWSTRRRYKQLLKVYRRGQFAAQARDLNALEAVFPVIEEFELEEINPAFVAKLIDLKAFLEAETHVLNLIKEACKSRDIEQLKAAKISAQGLTQEYPTESQSEALVKAKGRASTIIAELEKVNKIKELLKTAMLHESIKELELATQLAEEKGGELEFKSLAEALKLLDRLKKEQAVIADFESVYSVMEAKKKMDLKDIEKLELVSDKLRLISGDSKCTARVSAADRLMRNALGSLMEKAEAIDDANFMEEMLIPKAGAMGFAKLETNGMDWLQKKRQAEAKRKEQLEKDEAKRKEEARKEEESKAEAAKVAEATKPEPEPKTPVKENLKTQKAQESSKTNQEVQKFSVGAIVMVTGLSSNVQYNERVGQVQGYASANKRYVVMLGNNERLGVREKNLKVADATTEHVFARKQEMTSEKNKVTEKAKEDIGRDGVQLRADLCEELRKAAEDRDEKQLIRLLDLPEVQEAETHKDVRMAQDTLQLIRDAAEASEKLEKAIEDVKTTQIKAWLHKISEMGLEDKQKHTNPVDRKKLKELVDRGRHIAYLMTKQELLVLKLRKALKDLNKTKLKFLLRFATTSWLRAQPEVFQAESFLSSNPEMTTSQVMTPPKIDLDQSLSSRRSGSPPSNGSRKRRDNQTKRSSLNGQLREALRQYQKIRGLHPLGSLLRVRTESQWLKKIFFSRKYLKRHRLIHQSQPLPHSVTTLKTSSHDVKQRAKSMFRNILFYAQESYHAYPVTLGYKVIHEAVGEPQLRPEIYCQLIKQCTNIKSQMSLIRYWKLLFMCLNAFEPEGEVKLCILSFAAKYANFDVKLNDPVIRNKLRVLDKVETLATLMLILQFQRPISGRTPTMEEVRKVTDMHMLPESLEPPVMQVYRDKLDLKSTVSTTPTSTIKL